MKVEKVETSDLIRGGTRSGFEMYECKRCKREIKVPSEIDFGDRDEYATREHPECVAK